MRGTKSVCLLCRHIARNPQRQGQITRFSTATSTRYDDPTTTPTPRSSDDSLPTGAVAGEPSRNKVRRIVHESNRRRGSSNFRWSQNRPAKASTKDSARVDALFQQIVNEQTARKDAPVISPPENSKNNLALVNAIGNLERMFKDDGSEVKAYNYLMNEIYPIIQDPDVIVPKVFYRVVPILMEKIIAAKRKAIRSPELPSVPDIFRVYTDINDMNPQRWAVLVGELIQSIVQIKPEVEKQGLALAQGGLVRHDAMLADLVESWKILSLPKVVPPQSDDVLSDGFWFPMLDKFSLKKYSDMGNFTAALSSIFPHHSRDELGAPVAVLAIVTYALLLEPQRSNADARRSATRFINMLSYLIAHVNFRDASLQRLTSTHFPGLESYIMARWPRLKEELKERVESITTLSTTQVNTIESPSTSGRKFNAASLGGHLARAVTSSRNNEVDRLWEKFVGSEKDIPSDRAEELRKHPELFDSFVGARMSLNRPDQAIAALNTLRQVGLKPTVKTWTLMLDGCKNSHNLNALKKVWTRIADSGMRLDVQIWTARVSGLIECRDFRGGLEALEEMNTLWKQSSRDENSTAVKPTIEPVNAALVGLLRENRVSEAENLVVWAGKQGIEPDIFTYNTLLRRFVRDRRTNDVRAIFDLMRDTGVNADEATFTIVIDAAFQGIDPDDTEEQLKTVAGVLDDMHAAGLEANIITYGKMINSLLRLGDRSHIAIKAVLARLWDQGYELSTHIYTMLIDHYFARNPPDLNAVESLLRRRRLLDYDDMDPTFYNSVIKGFTRVGRLNKALEFYHRVAKAGNTIFLNTQLSLLNALLEQERVDEANDVVATAKKMFEEPKNEAGKVRFPDHSFWSSARRYGLLKE
ncbi:uncharacterized protein F4822DRAFT_27273 [Hypoxylon trugodes]|uniref:uncharacterized protein n=1 Tax=Hypoxylon trugodes TaxID=326681 RepID=UPI0021A02E9C|nr:uncharacterized protein F4822DRAFT_27273 [Hypoxylon trugodes]KAI1393839.1 hypothetical protein F4822DRAFT_27273 [Hypoxylon trugodes]